MVFFCRVVVVCMFIFLIFCDFIRFKDEDDWDLKVLEICFSFFWFLLYSVGK